MKDRRQRVAAVSKVNDYVAIEREGRSTHHLKN